MLSIVYVHVGTEKTEYLNMLRISAASVRKRMSSTDIVILTDSETAACLKKAEWTADEHLSIVPCDIPDGYSTVEKSRYLKTHLRELVRGDLLYIDSDTIVCEDVSDAVPPSSVCMVLDEHGLLAEQEYNGGAVMKAARERGLDLSGCVRYYNGGVIMAKDDEKARDFFRRWFELWDSTRKPKMHHDQYTLNYVNLQTDVIAELDGGWNCQITATYRAFPYLRRLKVLHYLSAQPHGIYRLNDIDLLRKDFTDEEIEAIISEPEKQFCPFHMFSDESEEYRIMEQSHFHLIYRMYTRHRGLYDFTEKLLRKLRK